MNTGIRVAPELATAVPCTTQPVETIRMLAAGGTLASVAASASPAERKRLTGAAFQLVMPIVYRRLTRRVELRRGHGRCASAPHRLVDECLDRFSDDVESVVDDLLTHASKPIANLEAWVASRLNAATVNGHRKRRGQRGALQRPRIPAWLAQCLGHDRWLVILATELLVWVGIPATAGTGAWPIDAWTVRRAETTGDWGGSDPTTVANDIERVLAAMRSRPTWYISYVEGPLGRKQAPVAPAPTPGTEHAALCLTEPDAAEEAHLRGLAADALAQIEIRTARGENPHTVVVEVVSTVFGAGTGRHELAHPPHTDLPHDERVRALLADAGTVERIVGAALSIVAGS